MGIVQEIIEAIKPIIESVTGFTQLDYEYDIDLNSDRGYTDKYGFIPQDATFVEGRAMGSSTINHTFQLILANDFNNQDDDTAQNTSLMGMYEKAQNLLKDLQKSRLVLPTPTNRVLLISGLSFDEPEFSGDNSTVALRLNFNIQYSYKNN